MHLGIQTAIIFHPCLFGDAVLRTIRILVIFVAFVLLITACLESPAGRLTIESAGAADSPLVSTSATQPPSAADRPLSQSPAAPAGIEGSRLWISPAAPPFLYEMLEELPGVELVKDPKEAGLRLEAAHGASAAGMTWVYALAAPFPTVTDGVTSLELRELWRGGGSTEEEGRSLLMSDDTRQAFEALWGKPAGGAVQIVDRSQLLATAWSKRDAWAVLPFEELGPRWKVLRVDGLSPLDQALDVDAYPLTIGFELLDQRGSPLSGTLGLPLTNREAGKMTTLVMTGTTAMVRHLALRMEEKGVTYPALDIQEWLREADLTHISNEVPFYDRCPPARPLRAGMRFCSSPAYLELLQFVGADMIELTGNHIFDWGEKAFLQTLQLYRENGLPYFGGGENLEEARRPLLFEHNGNRLAFLGCSPSGPENIWAGEEEPGSAPCDLDWMAEEIERLAGEGYVTIVTFQHVEVDDFKPHSAQRVYSQKMAEAGAVIVSGSQSHYPQTMTFVGDSFIHYGLGNLFFDQMDKWNRQAFIDRHIFYDGRYISSELLTVILEDYARLRPMTIQERQTLLTKIFQMASW